MAIPGRLELPTYGLGNHRSIRLSYGTLLILLKNCFYPGFWKVLAPDPRARAGTRAVHSRCDSYSFAGLQTTTRPPPPLVTSRIYDPSAAIFMVRTDRGAMVELITSIAGSIWPELVPGRSAIPYTAFVEGCGLRLERRDRPVRYLR